MLRSMQDLASRADTPEASERNYLELELNTLIQTDLSIWRFLRAGSLDGVWYWDLEKPENEWMSPEFWCALGVDPATKRSDPAEWQDLIFPEDLETTIKNFEKHCADPNHPYDQVVRYRHADGSTVWFRCRGIAVRDHDGKPVRLLGAHTDITKIKNAEMLAKEKLTLAEAANADLKSFSYAVSHDLKAPANTVEMLLTELQSQSKDTLDAEGTYLLSQSIETVGRMKHLIEYLLEFTEIAGTEPEFERVDLAATVQIVLQNLRADISAANAQVEVGPMPSVLAAPLQMQTLLQNLISNAIKYCAEDRKPVIRISGECDAAGNETTISVTDNGIGIAPEHQTRVLELFQRLHIRSDIPGNGIGLPLCRRIAMSHGGTLALESEPGTGTTVRLKLPKDRIG